MVDAQFGWSTIDGQVDSNGNGVIDSFDDSLGLIGSLDDVGFGDPTDGADVLAIGCGIRAFGCLAIPFPLNGSVDLDSDGIITAGDSCAHCFSGKGLDAGYVTDGRGAGGGGGPTPTPLPPVASHDRTTSMSFGQQLVAAGGVSVMDGTEECAAMVRVNIQWRAHHDWRTVGHTRTDAHGAFRVHTPDRTGTYRARAPRTTLASGDVCTRTTSPPVWNRR